MKKVKAYLIGLAVVAFFVQPYFFGKLIGFNMEYPIAGYIISCIAEFAIVALLYAPYAIGDSFLEKSKGKKK